MDKLPWCVAPFIGLYKVPHRMSACCELVHDAINPETFEEYWNHPKIMAHRKALLEWDYDALPKNCQDCIRSPTSTRDFLYQHGFRGYLKEAYEKHGSAVHPDGYMPHNKLYYLTIGTSAKCNAACRMCHPTVSNKRWEAACKYGYDEDRYIDSKIMETDTAEPWVKLIRDNADTLREVVLHGGDPIQSPHMPEIMDALMPLKDTCRIVFLNNGSFSHMVDGRNIWDCFKNFKDLHITFSMDGIPEVNEYIRVGIKHKRLMKTMIEAREKLPQIEHFCVHATLSTYAMLRYDEFLDYILDVLVPMGIYVTHNVVLEPAAYCPSNMPHEMKKEIYRKLSAKRYDHKMVEGLRRTALQALMVKKQDTKHYADMLRWDTKQDLDSKGMLDRGKVFPMYDFDLGIPIKEVT